MTSGVIFAHEKEPS